jgi:hypothetical protein
LRPQLALQELLPAFAIAAFFTAFSNSANAQLTTPTPLAEPALACSFRHPICVHNANSTNVHVALDVIAEAERAWDVAVDVMNFPEPDRDPKTGAYDIYLEPVVDGGTQTFASDRDVGSGVDRASAFTLLDSRLTGASRAHSISRGIFRAIAYRVSPATTPAIAEAQSVALADLVVPQAAQRNSFFESHPERAVCDSLPDEPQLSFPFVHDASFFYSWLDDAYANEPGGFTRALWALTPTVTPVAATHWTSDPDTFDVLRTTFKVQNTINGFPDFLLDFAIARAFDADGHARRDWEIDWPSTPRRLAPAFPIAPTGSSFILIRRNGAPAGSRLRVEATWEEHAAFHWGAVKLAADGSEIARMTIPAQDKATDAQITIDNLDGVGAVLLVAVNAGDDSVPFDPDALVWEPHGYLITLAQQ